MKNMPDSHAPDSDWIEFYSSVFASYPRQKQESVRDILEDVEGLGNHQYQRFTRLQQIALNRLLNTDIS